MIIQEKNIVFFYQILPYEKVYIQFQAQFYMPIKL